MKNSDKTTMKQVFQNGKRFAMAVVVILMATSMVKAQEPYVFIEGSIHSFSVTNNPANTFAWSMDIDANNNIDLDPSAYDLLEGSDSSAVTVQFTNMGRAAAELVYLVVEESAPNGCSTKRALQIQLEPNNMYFDFAALPNADDCYNFDENYVAEVQVGMNFKDRKGVADMAIPESRFPLMVKYTVENKTDGGSIIQGNGGAAVEIAFSDLNLYTLEISEAKGELTRTVEYELAITEVVDKFGTLITHDVDRRLQIRIMNHLPQNGGMDMVMAYNIMPVSYNNIK